MSKRADEYLEKARRRLPPEEFEALKKRAEGLPPFSRLGLAIGIAVAALIVGCRS
jgi:hypothetical protein